jgi:hypothetical protein
MRTRRQLGNKLLAAGVDGGAICGEPPEFRKTHAPRRVHLENQQSVEGDRVSDARR